MISPTWSATSADSGRTASALKAALAAEAGVDEKDFYLTRNGRSFAGDDRLRDDDVVRVGMVGWLIHGSGSKRLPAVIDASRTPTKTFSVRLRL